MQRTAETVVRDFILQVRSGNAPDTVADYMAATVIAHQVISGAEHIIERTPQDYSEHIHEFLACYGPYQLQIEELIAQDNKVYVRWQQVGIQQENQGLIAQLRNNRND